MEIIRQNRRTLVITVKENGEVIAKAPLFMSSKKIVEFIQEKSGWIQKQQIKLAERENITSQYDFEKYVYINGNKYLWEDVKNQDKRMTKASFYTKNFNNFVIIRAEQWSKLFKKAISFRLCNSRSIWGSCNASNVIKLNWKMILLPQELQDYIIVHELCHTIQLNHSPKFWNEVGKYLPDYKKRKNDLKSYSIILREQVL